MTPCIIGRSSSHHTRVVRMIAAEARVECAFQIVPDLMSLEPGDYGGNPALKLPALKIGADVWYGTLNISRVLARRSVRRPDIIWPEALSTPLLANAQELILQAMSTEVGLITAALAARTDDAAQIKMRTSLAGSLAWLDSRIGEILAALPCDRELSYLEITLFCLVTHLEFRKVLSIAPYQNLGVFCGRYGERASARQTQYRFD